MKYLFLLIAAAAISCSTVHRSQNIITKIKWVSDDGDRFIVRIGPDEVLFNRQPGDTIWIGKSINISLGRRFK